MQRVALHPERLEVGARELFVERAFEEPFVGTVELVADERVADRRQVHADLVLATREGQARDQRAVFEALEHAPVGARGLAVGEDRHLELDLRDARLADRHVDRAAVALGHAPDDRLVLLLDLAALELAHHVGVRDGVLADQHDAAGLAVEPVAQARRAAALELEALAIALVYALDQRVREVAAGGMHDDHGRLVDRQDRLVLVEDRELVRALLEHRQAQLLGDQHHDARAVAQVPARALLVDELAGTLGLVGCRGIDEHEAVADQALERGARAPVEMVRQEGVESDVDLLALHAQAAAVDAQLHLVGCLREVALLAEDAHDSFQDRGSVHLRKDPGLPGSLAVPIAVRLAGSAAVAAATASAVTAATTAAVAAAAEAPTPATGPAAGSTATAGEARLHRALHTALGARVVLAGRLLDHAQALTTLPAALVGALLVEGVGLGQAEDPAVVALALEAPQGSFEGLVRTDLDLDHSATILGRRFGIRAQCRQGAAVRNRAEEDTFAFGREEGSAGFGPARLRASLHEPGTDAGEGG